MPYVLPSSTIDNPQTAPLPLPSALALSSLPPSSPRSHDHAEFDIDQSDATLSSSPTATSSPTMASTLSSTATTAHASGIAPPSPPTPVGFLANNFNGVGLSDTAIATLRDNHHEADPVMIATSSSAPMPSLTVQNDLSGSVADSDSALSSRRPSEPVSLPDLTLSTHGDTSSSSTSIDTLADSPTDSAGCHGPAAQVLLAGVSGEEEQEQDPKMAALARYKEGLYTYTRGLYLEAKMSTSRSDKRRASTSSGGTGFGATKQSGMERLAAKKALAKRLNA